jgi:hypothetical protein
MKKSTEKNDQNSPETKPDYYYGTEQEIAAKDSPETSVAAVDANVMEVAAKSGVSEDDIKIYGR